MRKKHFIALLLVLVMLAASSCNGSGEGVGSNTDTSALSSGVTEDTTVAEAVRLIENGGSRFVVTRPDNSGELVIEAMKTVINGINDKTGVSLSPKTDWLNSSAGETAPEYEILIGATNRPETAEVTAKINGEFDYRIEVVGKKLVIAGGSDLATLRAAEYFINNLFSNDFAVTSGVLYAGQCSEEDRIVLLDGEVSRKVTELYSGVTSTHYVLSADSKYGQQDFTVVEFNPKQADLYFDVVMGGTYATTLKTVKATVEGFANSNGAGKTPIAAINGDLWMVSYAHARVLGSTTTYKNYSDPVVTKALTVPRGFNMYNGEIITSAHMTQETPYEGTFYAFGITEDGVPALGNPQVGISIKDVTQNTTTTADGLNRLPANNALVMYSDKLSNNYSLDEAYEVIIDCSYDYVVCHGAVITGTVTAVTKPGEAKQAFTANRIVLTARGNRIDRISGIKVGDIIEISITVTDKMGNSAIWQKMKNAVGGHIPAVIKGISQNSSDSTQYPMSVIGIKRNGNVVMLTNDGRQSGYSIGIKISQLDELCADLDIVTCLLLDGGGSASMVQLLGGTYTLVNRPSDKFADGTYGSPRSVVNTVILSYGPKRS